MRLPIILILIDQLSKYIIRHYDGFYICNEGVAFGLRLPYSPILLIIAILILIYVSTRKRKSEALSPEQYRNIDTQYPRQFWISNKYHLPLLMIIAGGASNLIDRLYFNCVIDFIDLRFWPVFNIADIYITIGSAILIYISILKSRKN